MSIIESTCPGLTTDDVLLQLEQLRPDLKGPQSNLESPDYHLAYCPERVLPGKVMSELKSNDRVIGGVSRRCSEKAMDVYRSFLEGHCVIASNPRTAEMTKLTENSFRDVNIAFANELSLVCNDLGVDVWELIELANRHPRVEILQPGPGVGGHCIAVDPWFIVSKSPDKSNLIRTAREVNDNKPKWVLQKLGASVLDYMNENPSSRMSDLKLAVYGISFKPNIDELRESPALEITQRIIKDFSCDVHIVEPNIEKLPSTLTNCRLSKVDDVQDANIHVMLVDHNEFLTLPKPSGRVLDTRGVWKKSA